MTPPSDRPTGAGLGCRPGSEFLLAFDVEFRKRRLIFLIQGQNRLYATLGDAGRAAIQPARSMP